MKRAEIIVKGKVQKVGYRAKVVEIANNSEIVGYVENLEDGDVKIIAEGEKEKLEEFIEKIKIKDELIDVEDLSVKWSEPTNEFTGFRKIVKSGETDERLDTAAVHLKELINVTKQGFAENKKGFADLSNKQVQTINIIKEGNQMLAEKIDSGNKMLAEKIDSGNEKICSRIDSGNKMLAEKIDSGNEKICSRIDSGNKMLAEKIDSGNEKICSRIDSGNKMLAEKIDSGNEKLAGKLDVIHNDLSVKQDRTIKVLTETKNQMAERFDKLDNSFHSFHEDTVQRFDSLDLKYGQISEKMEKILEELKEEKEKSRVSMEKLINAVLKLAEKK